MLVTLESMKDLVGLNPDPVFLAIDIDATARTLTRAAGIWSTDGVSVGKKLTLGGFTNAANNVQVQIEAVTALELTYKVQSPVLVTESGVALNTYRIDNTTYDSFLTQQITMISATIEEYCRRKFEIATYKQTWYVEDLPRSKRAIFAYHFPFTEVPEIKVDDEVTAVDEDFFRVHLETSRIEPLLGFPNICTKMEVTYEAGLAEIPLPVQEVVYQLVQERYNKKKAGIDLNFGSDVQRVSVPGVISIDFDYSLQSNERKTALGIILGNTINVLDSYRSERAVLPNTTIEYVETT